ANGVLKAPLRLWESNRVSISNALSAGFESKANTNDLKGATNALDAGKLYGNISDARLSPNIPKKNANNVFLGSNYIIGAFAGEAPGLSNIFLTSTNLVVSELADVW